MRVPTFQQRCTQRSAFPRTRSCRSGCSSRSTFKYQGGFTIQQSHIYFLSQICLVVEGGDEGSSKTPQYWDPKAHTAFQSVRSLHGGVHDGSTDGHQRYQYPEDYSKLLLGEAHRVYQDDSHVDDGSCDCPSQVESNDVPGAIVEIAIILWIVERDPQRQ